MGRFRKWEAVSGYLFMVLKINYSFRQKYFKNRDGYYYKQTVVKSSLYIRFNNNFKKPHVDSLRKSFSVYRSIPFISII